MIKLIHYLFFYQHFEKLKKMIIEKSKSHPFLETQLHVHQGLFKINHLYCLDI